MRLIFTTLATFVLTAAIATPSMAEKRDPGDPPEEINGEPFRKFVNGDVYFGELTKEATQYEARVGACATPGEVERVTAGRPQLLTKFPDLGTPPQWMEILKINGCAKPVERAVLVLYVGKKLLFLPLVAGNALSRFDVMLQRDVIKTLMPVERTLAVRAGCDDDDKIRIVGTKTLSKKSTESGLAWEEEWHLANCKGAKSVRVSYNAAKTGGTTFQIKQTKPE